MGKRGHMIVQTGHRKWTYTDPEHPGHEVHITAFTAARKWMCVQLANGRIAGSVVDGEFLDALAIAASCIHSKEAAT